MGILTSRMLLNLRKATAVDVVTHNEHITVQVHPAPMTFGPSVTFSEDMELESIIEFSTPSPKTGRGEARVGRSMADLI